MAGTFRACVGFCGSRSDAACDTFTPRPAAVMLVTHASSALRF